MKNTCSLRTWATARCRLSKSNRSAAAAKSAMDARHANDLRFTPMAALRCHAPLTDAVSPGCVASNLMRQNVADRREPERLPVILSEIRLPLLQERCHAFL